MSKIKPLELHQIDITEELQTSFCNSALECFEECKDCIYYSENFELFKEKIKPKFKNDE